MGIVTAILLYVAGHIAAWFQYNLQFVNEWWQDKPLLAVCLFSVPMSYSFWYATKIFVAHTGYLWTGRLMGFGVGIIVFSFLTMLIMKESVFNVKTLSCLFLAILIVLIQVFYE